MRACVPCTPLGQGQLFMLFDPDALVGVTMCNRKMTAEEREEYSAHPTAWRRRKPGESIDDDEERARRRRTADLIAEIEANGRNNFG